VKGAPWSPADMQKLVDEYPHRRAADIARDLGVSISRVYAKASELGLHKSAEFMESDKCGRIQRGRTHPNMVATQFKKGNVPWTLGTKGIAGMHPNSRHTQFKKGEMSGSARAKYVPIGSYRISKDGYLEQKVTDDPNLVPARRWVGVHRLVWEAANGAIPRSHVVCFLPGRRTNVLDEITLDALELVHRGELARRNHPRARSPELAKLVQLKGAITKQVNRIAREAKEKEDEHDS
jgi:hypothetical protein